jgi:adenosylmethionine-8-amino-7-oxononanoate aminotransferase
MASSSETSENISEGLAFHYSLSVTPPEIVGGKGNYLFTKKGNFLFRRRGNKIFDACSGAAVSCLGHGNKRVNKAIYKQLKTGTPYLASSFWSSQVVKNLCKELIQGTDEKMAGVYLTGSGSDAIESAIKLSRQYFYEQGQLNRVNFIARERSYHGNTMGALSLSEFQARKEPYFPLLMGNVHHISSCYQYRQQKNGESDMEFVARKAAELEGKFQELGPDTVIGFIAEPVVGAALGCVPPPSGYLKAMKEVCHKHGALFILDEIMCGMGRTGTLHAWQAEDAQPDIQSIGKAFGAGYLPISGLLISEKVANVLKKENKDFIHGLTFQAMPVQAAAALEVQRIIREDKLIENVSKQGAELEQLLKAALGNHPHVGDIRGRGLFWALEFVKDKATKEPFDHKMKVAYEIKELARSKFNLAVYPTTGCSDGVNGDVIILAPTYIVNKKDVNHIAKTVKAVVDTYFSKFDR